MEKRVGTWGWTWRNSRTKVQKGQEKNLELDLARKIYNKLVKNRGCYGWCGPGGQERQLSGQEKLYKQERIKAHTKADSQQFSFQATSWQCGWGLHSESAEQTVVKNPPALLMFFALLAHVQKHYWVQP